MAKTKTEYPEGFERFWKAWPRHYRKASKCKCLAPWTKDRCEGRADNIVAVVEAMKRSKGWLKDEGAFIPAPLVWLNQARWDCDPKDIEQLGRPRRVQVVPSGPDEMAIVREFLTRPETVQGYWRAQIAEQHPDLPHGPLTFNATQAWWQAKQGEKDGD